MYGILAAAFAFYILVTGAIPVGRGPYFFSATVDTSSITIRLAGALILAGMFLPSALLTDWYGEIILISLGMLMLFIGLIASLSGRAR